jgi:hypothetical protein
MIERASHHVDQANVEASSPDASPSAGSSATGAGSFKLLCVLLLIANVVGWLVPSNVLKLVAEQKDVILGRYSVDHFTWLVVGLFLSLLVIRLVGASPVVRRRRLFALTIGAMVIVPGLVIIDLVLRKFTPDQYIMIKEGLAYHRPPGLETSFSYDDEPPTKRTYPNARGGSGRERIALNIDKRGFRNLFDKESYEFVVLGDSFAEGSSVTNLAAWPMVFARLQSADVYNLGMSGYDPQHYLAALKKYGAELNPKHVFCMIYEGNDFREAKWIENSETYRISTGERLKTAFKRSPLLYLANQFIRHQLGAVNSSGDFPGSELLSWMPVEVPSKNGPTYYTFTPKYLSYHLADETMLRMGKRWPQVRQNLAAIRDECEKLGATLTVVFAPSKAHVVLPMAKGLPADKVRGFAALKVNEEKLPESGEQFLKEMLANLSAMEDVTREFCEKEGIGFISITPALRDALRVGTQVYFTYDQHWTRKGQEAAAREVFIQWRTIQAGKAESSTS